jgi:hypothetical protein
MACEIVAVCDMAQMMKYLLALALIALAIPASATCYVVPNPYGFGNRVVCDPAPAYGSESVDSSIPLHAGQNIPNFSPWAGGERPAPTHCRSYRIGSSVYTDCQ